MFFFVVVFLTDPMMVVLLVPVMKNKAGKNGCSENDKPIALTSILSNLFKIILLERITEFVKTIYNGFGFNKKLGNDDMYRFSCRNDLQI